MNQPRGIFKKYPDVFLGLISLVFLTVIIWCYAWGLNSLVGSFAKALTIAPATAGEQGFQIDQAKKLDLRGLLPH